MMPSKTKKIAIKRVYQPAEDDDGFRILIDRLWPRGFSKERAKIDLWLKEIAPSTELRKWFNHDPEKWISFQKKYETEIDNNTECVEVVKKKLKEGNVCLVYAAKDEDHNDAIVLFNYFIK